MDKLQRYQTPDVPVRPLRIYATLMNCGNPQGHGTWYQYWCSAPHTDQDGTTMAEIFVKEMRHGTSYRGFSVQVYREHGANKIK